jgi:hypothetical protein
MARQKILKRYPEKGIHNPFTCQRKFGPSVPRNQSWYFLRNPHGRHGLKEQGGRLPVPGPFPGPGKVRARGSGSTPQYNMFFLSLIGVLLGADPKNKGLESGAE